MFRELFRRMPDIRTTGEPARLQSNFINGIKHLPASWTPATASLSPPPYPAPMSRVGPLAAALVLAVGATACGG